MLKSFKEVVEEKIEKNEVWLCPTCGTDKQFLGEIWGLPARRCDGCNTFRGPIKKYKWLG